MESIHTKDIPQFLHESVLYKNLQSKWNEDENIEFPNYCVATTDKINNLEDFIRIVKTCDYWMAEKPDSVYLFLINFLKEYLTSENNYLIFQNLIKNSLVEQNISTREFEDFITVVLYSKISQSKEDSPEQHSKQSLEPHSYMHLLSQKGHITALKFLRKNGFKWYLKVTDEAVINGHLECFKYIIEDGGIWDCYTIKKIIECEQIEFLKYMFESDALKTLIEPYKKYLMFIETAIKCGYLDIVKYFIENEFSKFNIEPLKEAIRYQRYEIFEYLYEWTKKNFYFSSKEWNSLGSILIIYGETKYLSLLVGKHIVLNEHLITIAYQHKSNMVFYFILDELYKTHKIHWFDNGIIPFICEKDDLENLVYLLDKKEYPILLIYTFKCSIKYSSIRILEYIISRYKNDFPVDYINNWLVWYIIYDENRFINDEFLKILINNGCKLYEANYPKDEMLLQKIEKYFSEYNARIQS